MHHCAPYTMGFECSCDDSTAKLQKGCRPWSCASNNDSHLHSTITSMTALFSPCFLPSRIMKLCAVLSNFLTFVFVLLKNVCGSWHTADRCLALQVPIVQGIVVSSALPFGRIPNPQGPYAYIYSIYIYSIYAFVCNAKTDVSVFWGARLRSLCMSLSWIQRNCTAFGCRMHSTAGSHHYRELAASYAQRQRDRRQTTQNAAVQCLQLNPKSKNASPRCTSPTR